MVSGRCIERESSELAQIRDSKGVVNKEIVYNGNRLE